MSPPSSTLPRRLWAKSPRPGETQGESLARHTSAVAAMLAQLAQRAPMLAEVAGEERLWHRAFWACWLHDLGKAAQPFQEYLRGKRGPWEHRHEVLSLAFLAWVAPLESADFAWIASAIASHHKDAPEILENRYRIDADPRRRNLRQLTDELDDESIRSVAEWLGLTAPEWLASSALSRLNIHPAGAVPQQVDLDQFGRDAPDLILTALRTYHALWQEQRRGVSASARRQGLLLRGLVMLSDHLASGHASRPQDLRIPGTVEILHGSRPRSHQERAQEGSGSIVLAAPTGSGKTEAALLWARRQLEDTGRTRRLIYLLPYQASLNAMQQRLDAVLRRNVGLLHSRSAQVLYRELTADGYTSAEAERKARRAVDLARLHHPPTWVATPYQLLRAAYRLRGYEQSWAALGKSLVVLDEPHAYDVRRLGLLFGLLRELVVGWDVRICAMTATLPTWLRMLLQDMLKAESIAIDRQLFADFRRHRVVLVPGQVVDPLVIRRVVDDVQAGRSVLVGVNTVARAQAVRTALLKAIGPDRVWLLHSRFTGRDRLAREDATVTRLRSGEARSRSAVRSLAVVASQVIEVSLDLDFDTLYTEPAPLEALAQRFGRVNRGAKKGIVPVHVLTSPTDGQAIYDARLVQGTLRVLADMDGCEVDEAELGEALDSVYSHGLHEEFAGQVEQSRAEFDRLCLRSLHAFESDDGLEEQFDSLFDSTEVLPEAFVGAYRQDLEDSVLKAQSLLVPLSTRQLGRLRGVSHWDRELKLRIVDVPYDSELGLQLRGHAALGD